MQSGLEIGEGTITGTINYIESGPLVEYGGAGYYMALSFSDLDETATSVTVQMNPDGGMAPIELVGMENPSGVFKITNTSQVLEIISTDGADQTLTQTFALDGIELVEPETTGE